MDKEATIEQLRTIIAAVEAGELLEANVSHDRAARPAPLAPEFNVNVRLRYTRKEA